MTFSAIGGEAVAQDSIPVRRLASAHASLSRLLGSLPSVAQLSNGSVVINDVRNREILFADSTLQKVVAVSDTTASTSIPYGRRDAIMIEYPGDSIFVIEPAAEAMTIIGPNGLFARAAAHPRASDFLVNPGRVLADARGRLYYRIVPLVPRLLPPARGTTTVQRGPDSALLLRADLETRVVDTVARLQIPVLQELHTTVGVGGDVTSRYVVQPFSWVDDWTLHPDGSVVVVRGRDYRIDWIGADGTRQSSARMPYDWVRVTDEQKRALADSARALAQALQDSARARAARMRVSPGAVRNAGSRSLTDGTSTAIPLDAVITAAPLSEIPDYFPPIRPGTLLSDREGRIWIIPLTSRYAGGGVVYDVVNRAGVIVERVQLPRGRVIVGFGRNGVLFVAWRDGDSAWRLDAVRVLRN